MLEKIYNARAKVLEKNFIHLRLRLTPHDNKLLLDEMTNMMGIQGRLQVKTYLGMDVLMDISIPHSRVEPSLYPYSIMEEYWSKIE